MLLCTFTHKYGVDSYLARNKREAKLIKIKLRSDIAEKHFHKISDQEWSGSEDQVELFWSKLQEERNWYQVTPVYFYFQS